MTEQTPNREVVQGPQKMTPSEAFVETMVANDVTDIFGIMGSAFMDAMDIFAPAGIRLIPVVHEQGAAHMADGYARASGRHGVVIGQNGPGISNCVTGIAAAYWAHSPVVIVTPEAGTNSIGLGGFQEAHQLPMFQEFTKYQGHVVNPARMAEFTARCFDRAMSENGPTQLNIPRDYFYGEITAEIPQPRRVDRGAGGTKSLDEAAELLATAKNPVIVSGGGVVMADGVEECKALAERLGAPVVNSYQHNDSFPASHPLWCGPLGYQGSKAGMKLISEADVVIALAPGWDPSARCPSTARPTGPPRRRSSRWTRTTPCSAWSRRSTSASAATRRPPPPNWSSGSRAAPWPATPPRRSAPRGSRRRRTPGSRSSPSGRTRRTSTAWT
ncbi:thiamine pyrophosphate-binding protein [Crystallibacter crystallopoietes]|uniref:thiamine pyrophosphate-binding protein n=1 Tax=Crystallibacter crystallopoietes TaxID=37928 RepID=UPI0002FE5CCB|nr:thiamine pyrophosphate-binding protein [Arthrobacter crystallopoietes]